MGQLVLKLQGSKSQVAEITSSKMAGTGITSPVSKLPSVTVLALMSSLFFTNVACGIAFNGGRSNGGEQPVVQVTAQPSVPADVDAPAAAQAPAATSGAQAPAADTASAPVEAQKPAAPVGSLRMYIQGPEVVERVQKVVGWLEFVAQPQLAALLKQNWQELSTGEVAVDAASMKVAEEFINSTTEYRTNFPAMPTRLWSQLLGLKERTPSSDALLVMLVSAQYPDELEKSENVALKAGVIQPMRVGSAVNP